MWCITNRRRSWKAYLGVCCGLLAGTYITFQTLAWLMIGPQEEYQLNGNVIREMEKVTSGVNLDAPLRKPNVALLQEPGDDRPKKRRPGKQSALLKRFGSRNKLLSAVRRILEPKVSSDSPHNARHQHMGPEPEEEQHPTQAERKRQQQRQHKRKRKIDWAVMKRAKTAVAERKRKETLRGIGQVADQQPALSRSNGAKDLRGRNLDDFENPGGLHAAAAQLVKESTRRHAEHTSTDQHADSVRPRSALPASSHSVSRLRGVPPSKRKLYDLPPDGVFRCLDGKGTGLSPDQINDEYCDCVDGSDEPGTSACATGRFYCPVEKTFIFASRVDDGTCDCCDRADEQREPTHPCRLSCQELQRDETARTERRQRALEIRTDYVEKARPAPKRFGPDNAFWVLSQRCFTKRQGEYDYKVCPFEHAEQNKGSSGTPIGAGGEWRTLSTLPTIVTLSDPSSLLRDANGRGYSVLYMSGGRACPSGESRALQIAFECDVEEKLKAIGETEKCLYTALLSTPAACSPT